MILSFASIIIVVSQCCAEKLIVEENAVTVPEEEELVVMTTANPIEFDIDSAIQGLESLAHAGENIKKFGITALEDIENIHSDMIAVLDYIEDALKYEKNVDTFVEAQGFFRVFSKNLYNTHTALRTRLLELLKVLLDKISEDTKKSNIPINIIDGVLNIFEKDDNLAVKAHAIDVLYILLPKNPVAQLRVMKVKGLEVFYKQINKLDISVIETLMNLFNEIVKEHNMQVREDYEKDYGEDKLIYQRMGLMEHLSTPDVCNGMLHILTMLWSHNSHGHGNVKTFQELLKNIQPYCAKVYKRKPKAISFFESLQKKLREQNRMDYFDQNDVNFRELIDVIEGYLVTKVDKKDLAKDEF